MSCLGTANSWSFVIGARIDRHCRSLIWSHYIPVHLWMSQSHRTLPFQPYLFVINYLRSESFKVISRIVPTGNLKTSASCNNSTRRHCFALFQFHQIPPQDWFWVGRQLPFMTVGFSYMDAIAIRRFRWAGPSWESGFICGVAVGRTLGPVAPTPLGSAYTMDLVESGVQGQWGY